MATYKGIQGYTVQKLSSDPTASEVEGQLWYNSSTGAFKLGVAGAGAWASGGTMNTGRDSFSSFGLQTAAIAVAGYITPTLQNKTEEYNGTSWTEKNNCLTARRLSSGAGTTTAGIFFGGLALPTSTNLDLTEIWNGTSWTEANDLTSARRNAGSAKDGTTTATLYFGGDDSGVQDKCESWNGTSWTEVNDMNTAREYPAGLGTQTAALAYGGGPGNPDHTEKWDGTSWTEVNDLNTGRALIGSAGINTAGLAIGGEPSRTITEKYDGTSWTEVADLSTGRGSCGGAGTTTLGLAYGGSASISSSEEWNDPVYTIKTVTVS